MGNPNTTLRRVLVFGLGVSVFTSAGIAPACAMAMPGLSKKSSSSFDLPTAEKLDGDTAGDAQPVQADSPELAPMTLKDGPSAPTPAAPAESSTTSATTPADADGTLNATVTTNTFVPKGPLEGDNSGLLAPTSMKGSKTKSIESLGGKLLDQANTVNAMPVPLMESSADAERKADESQELEREQLTALWEATLTRSPDINFVLTKLMPTSEPSKTSSVMMRMLSTAMFGAIGTVGAVYPGAGTYALQNLSYSTLSQLLGAVESNGAKKAKVTQTEQIQLFNMIRSTADKLVEDYRTYKKHHLQLHKANSDFEDFKAVAAEGRKTEDRAKQLDIEYTLRRQQRDIDSIGFDLSKVRQGLVDKAGQEAVAKLDQQIDEEFQKLHPELAPQNNPQENVAGQSPGSEQPATLPAAERLAGSGAVSEPANDSEKLQDGQKHTHVADSPSSKSNFKVPL